MSNSNVKNQVPLAELDILAKHLADINLTDCNSEYEHTITDTLIMLKELRKYW
jgi:hypothetical protein